MNRLTYYNRLYFLNSHNCDKQVDVFDDKSQTWKKEFLVAREHRRLVCKYCPRVFHKRFGLSRHTRQMHREEVLRSLKGISGTSHYRYKRDVSHF